MSWVNEPVAAVERPDSASFAEKPAETFEPRRLSEHDRLSVGAVVSTLTVSEAVGEAQPSKSATWSDAVNIPFVL